MKRPSTIGLIAGAGELPLEFAHQAKVKGLALKIVAIKGSASTSVANWTDQVHWISIGQLGSLISFFKKQGVQRAVMHGKVQHSLIFKNLRLDWKAISIWTRLKDRSGEGLLKAVALELKKNGVVVMDSRFLMERSLVQKGWLVKARGDRYNPEAVHYGLKRARKLAALRIGQTVAVKGNAIVAVEAMEGTNETILRAGRWGGPGTIVVKVASPQQDWRFDVPTLGPQTIQNLRKAKAAGIVVENNRAFLLNKEKTISLAQKHGIFILGI